MGDILLNLACKLNNFFENTILFNKVRYLYIYFFIFCLLIRQIGIFALVPVFIDSSIFSTFGICGLLIAIWGIKNKYIYFSFKKNYLLLFIFAVFISSIINFKYGFFKNLKDIIWLFITFFIIYSSPKSESENDKIRKFCKIQNLITYVWGTLAFCSILTVFMQISYISYVKDDWYLRVGIVENRLFGIFNNTNSASIISLISLIFSTYQIKFKNVFCTKRWINLSNIIVQFIYISLSESRGTYMVLMFASFLTSLFWFYDKLGRKKKVKNILASILFSVFVSFFILVSIFLIIKLFKFISIFYSIIFGDNAQNLAVSKRVDFINNNDISNLRFRLWLDSWKVFKNNWLFGVTAGNLVNYAKIHFPQSLIATRNYSRVHNTWIGFLLFNGIFGGLILFAFFINKIIDIFTYYSKHSVYKTNSIFNLCILIVLCICLYGTVESEILFVNSTVSIVFWISLGFINQFLSNYSNYDIIK